MLRIETQQDPAECSHLDSSYSCITERKNSVYLLDQISQHSEQFFSLDVHFSPVEPVGLLEELREVLWCSLSHSFLFFSHFIANPSVVYILFSSSSWLSLAASDGFSPLGAWYVRHLATPFPPLVILAHVVNAVYFSVGAQVNFTGNMALPHGNQIISGCSYPALCSWRGPTKCSLCSCHPTTAEPAEQF